jgi:hypothetical protein
MMDLSWQPGQTLEQVEKAIILKAFRFFQGNKTRTANALGIAIRTLENKLSSYEGKPNESGNQSKAEGTSEEKQSDIRAEAGPSVEPIKKVSEKLNVPMRKR